MVVLSRVALIAVTAVVVVTAGTILFWLKPQELGVSTPDAWASFQTGSIFGILLWSLPWLVVTGIVVAIGFRRLGIARPARRGARLLGTLKWCAVAASVAATLSFLPFVPLDLALEHVVESSRRTSLAWPPLSVLLVVGAGLVPLALGLAVLEAVIRGEFACPAGHESEAARIL